MLSGLRSPLGGFSSPFIRRVVDSILNTYAANGIDPQYVADWKNDFYSKAGASRTFAEALEHTATAPMVTTDADGFLKWSPHNLAVNSATPATQSITAVIGNDYTVECTGAGSITLSGAGTGSVTDGSPVEVTATTTTLTLTVVGSLDTMWAYRSDLGGMAPVPVADRVVGSETYVPTVASPVFLPRRNHYVYDGASYIRQGLRFESDAATNLALHSKDFINASWLRTNVTPTADVTVSPSGLMDATELTADAVSSEHRIFRNTGASDTYARSVYAKAGTAGFIALGAGTRAGGYAVFDLSAGVVAIEASIAQAYIEDVGNGWYRCGIKNSIANTFLVINMGDTALNAVPQTAWTGAGETVYLYGAQLEASPTPTSYIPTAGATVTRPAETLTLPTEDIDYPTGSPLAVSMSFKGLVSGTSNTFIDWTLDASNGILTQSGASDFTFTQEAGGVVDAVTGGSYASEINVPISVASRHGETFINGAVGGVALTANTTPVAFPDLSATDIQIAPLFNGVLQELVFWGGTTGDIGDTGLEEASA